MHGRPVQSRARSPPAGSASRAPSAPTGRFAASSPEGFGVGGSQPSKRSFSPTPSASSGAVMQASWSPPQGGTRSIGNAWPTTQADAWWAEKAASSPPSHTEAFASTTLGNSSSRVDSPNANPAEEADVPAKAMANALFDTLDTNSDNVLSRTEFVAAFEPQKPPSRRNSDAGSSLRQRSAMTRLAHPPTFEAAQSPPTAMPSATCGTSAIGDVLLSPDGQSPSSACENTICPDWFPSPPPDAKVHDLPKVATRLVETVVAQEIESLGECLNICAQRSRTLKLIGFQHMHFDARLQDFLESRARSLGILVVEIILITRALFAFRENTRFSYLWKCQKQAQVRLCGAAAENAELGNQVLDKSRLARLQFEKDMQHSNRLTLVRSFANWQRAALLHKCDSLAENSRRQHATVLKQIGSKLEHDNSSCLREAFKAFTIYLQRIRAAKASKNRLIETELRCSQGLLRECLHLWHEDVTVKKAGVNMSRLQRQKTTHILGSLLSNIFRLAVVTGVRFHISWVLWQAQWRNRRGEGLVMKHLTRQVTSTAKSVMEGCFHGWSCIQKDQVEKQRRHHNMMRVFERRKQQANTSLLMILLQVWRKHRVASARRRASKISLMRLCDHTSREDDFKLLLIHFIMWRLNYMNAKQCSALQVVAQVQAAHDNAMQLVTRVQAGQVLMLEKAKEQRSRKRDLITNLMAKIAVSHLRRLFQTWREGLRQVNGCRARKQLVMRTTGRQLEREDTHAISYWWGIWKQTVAQIKKEDLRAQLDQYKRHMRTQIAHVRQTMCSRLVAFAEKAHVGICVNVWARLVLTSALIRASKQDNRGIASKLLDRIDMQELHTICREWFNASRCARLERQMTALTQELRDAEEAARVRSSAQKATNLSFAQQQITSSSAAIALACWLGWLAVVHETLRDKLAKHNSAVQAARLINCRSHELLVFVFRVWLRERWSSKCFGMRAEILVHEQHCEQRLEDEHKASRVSVAAAHKMKRDAVAKTIEQHLWRSLHACLAAWADAVQAAARSRAIRKQHYLLMEHRAGRVDKDLQDMMFTIWVRTAQELKWNRWQQQSKEEVSQWQFSIRGRFKGLREKNRKAFHKSQAEALRRLKAQVIRIWGVLVQRSKESLRHRAKICSLRERLFTKYHHLALLSCILLWRVVIVESLCAKTKANMLSSVDTQKKRCARCTGDRLWLMWRHIACSRALADWRCALMLKDQNLRESRRFYDCQAKHRAFIIRMRGRMTEMTFLLSWFRVVPLKPYEAPAWKRVPEFMREPPALYVRPVSQTQPGGTDITMMPSKQILQDDASKPAMLTDVPSPNEEKSGSNTVQVATTASSSVGVPPSGALTVAPVVSTAPPETLRPGERYVLASQAITSDAEYKRLLEYNRREIREGRGTSNVLSANASTRVWDLGPATQAPRVAGWGLWIHE